MGLGDVVSVCLDLEEEDPTEGLYITIKIWGQDPRHHHEIIRDERREKISPGLLAKFAHCALRTAPLPCPCLPPPNSVIFRLNEPRSLSQPGGFPSWPPTQDKEH